MKKLLYIDMDNVLVDFPSGIKQINQADLKEYEGRYDEVSGIFSLMQPMDNAIESITELAKHFDIYILSTAPWLNSSAWSDKVKWIQKYFGKGEESVLYKRLILSHHKNLNKGDFLVDDRDANGAKYFEGELISFGSEEFSDWENTTKYLLKKL